MKSKTRLFNLIIILTLFLAACNLPSGDNEGVIGTPAADGQPYEK